METADFVIVGGDVIGTSIAFHLARMEAKRLLLLERNALGGGTTVQSSCIVRTYYSVPENVALAPAGLAVFEHFAEYMGDADAESGWNRCGIMIVAPPGERAEAMRGTLAVERRLGLEAREVTQDEVRAIHPLLQFDDIAAIGWEPRAGYADAYLTLSAYVRGARRHGAVLREGVALTGLTRDGRGRVIGVETAQGKVAAGCVISTQNIWAHELAAWTGIELPLTLSPVVGRILAQSALVHATDHPLAPYSLACFSGGHLLQGRYGAGAVS